jgi:hypothetical protein
MKNAFVTDHHIGENGNVTEGMILENISDKRFETLEKKGLVREATAEEVENGFKAPFIPTGFADAGETGEAGEKAAADPKNKKAPAAATKAA